jgi:peptidylprolyl isomerase
VQNNSVVLFDYVAKTCDGEVFDTSLEKEAKKAGVYVSKRKYKPFRIIIGQHNILPALEEALIGMKEGESNKVTISPEEAYGRADPNRTQEVKKEVFETKGVKPEKGKWVKIRTLGGRSATAVIQDINDETVVINKNHPLAGKTLDFQLTVRKIR